MNKEQQAARDAAITKFDEQWAFSGDEYPFKEFIAQVYDAGYAARDAEDAWVAVSDRLPEITNPWPVQVLIQIQIGDHVLADTAKFYKGEWTDDGGKLIEAELPPAKVIAWMPIPKHQPTEHE